MSVPALCLVIRQRVSLTTRSSTSHKWAFVGHLMLLDSCGLTVLQRGHVAVGECERLPPPLLRAGLEEQVARRLHTLQ